ncbi:MAG: MFS transporter, partial [Dehalococcoidia bacterium]|nr:MFS transporter [Dehalococcoidia bacterium]
GALGGVIVPLTVLSLEGIGWRSTAMVSGILVLVVGLPVTSLLVRSPAELGLEPDGDSPEAAA